MFFVLLNQNALLPLTFLIYALISINHFLLQIPTVGLLERIACDDHHGELSATTAPCDVPKVQGKIALLLGWKMCFDTLPALISPPCCPFKRDLAEASRGLFAMYYGTLAEQFGKRRLIQLACLGDLLRMIWLVVVGLFSETFPAQTAWLSLLFLLVGGGPQISKSLIVTIVSQSTEVG